MNKKQMIMMKKRAAQKERMARAEKEEDALNELATRLNLDHHSMEFQQLGDALRSIPTLNSMIEHSGIVEVVQEEHYPPTDEHLTVPEEEPADASVMNCDTAQSLISPGEVDADLATCLTPTSLVSRCELRIHGQGNLFVVCAGCSAMVLLATDRASVSAIAEVDCPNAIVFSWCKMCKEAGCQKGSKRSAMFVDLLGLSPRVLAGAQIISVAQKIVGMDVPIAARLGEIIVRQFLSITSAITGCYRMMSLDTSLEGSAVAESIVLPYVEGRFV